MKIRADQLGTHLAKTLLPCYLVAGDEPLLVGDALDSLRAAARERGYSERDVQVAERGYDWRELAAAAASQSLFAERRILELRLPTGKPGKAGSAAIAEFADNPPPDTLLLVSAPKLERSQASARWVKALSAAGGMVQVWPVDARELPGWIASRMRARGLAPSRDAVAMLADRVEGNLLAAEQEIEKLRLLCGEGPVDVAEVEQAVADSARFNVFKLADAALAGDGARAVKIVGALRGEGVTPVLVVWALARELRALAGMRRTLDAGKPMAKVIAEARVWAQRQALVRAALGRHGLGALYRLLALAERADSIVKGQAPGEPWRAALALTVAFAGRSAATATASPARPAAGASTDALAMAELTMGTLTTAAAAARP